MGCKQDKELLFQQILLPPDTSQKEKQNEGHCGRGKKVVSCRMACNPRQDGLRRLPKTRSSIARFKRVTTIYHSWKGYYLCDGSDLAGKLTYPTGGHGSQFEPWARRGKYDNPLHPRKRGCRMLCAILRNTWPKSFVLVTPTRKSIRFYRGKIERNTYFLVTLHCKRQDFIYRH